MSANQPGLLVLLPGLGADARQFDPQRAAFPDLVVPPWIAPRPREPLSEYAQRMAETLPRGSHLVLGGSSFGGMVAWEMARHAKPAALVLIGSCRGPEGVRPLLRALRPIAPLVPTPAFQIVKRLAAPAARLFSSLEPRHRELCVRMFLDADPRFMKWGGRAIFAWQPSPLPPGVLIRQIHGSKDPALPAARSEADAIVPGAGHLVNLTHAEAVNGLLGKVVRAVG